MSVKVFVVDDELIFREHICSTILWEAHGLSLCGQAENGRDALEKFNEISPDIVLLDVNMPFMDGLTLGERLREINPNIEMVIISGYDEFEFAKKAMKLGVNNYILKPFENEELISTLLKIKTKIENRHQHERFVQKSIAEMEDALLYRLIHNFDHSQTEKIREELLHLNILIKSNRFQTAVIEFENREEKTLPSENFAYLRTNIKFILKELLTHRGNHLIFNHSDNTILVVMEIESSGGCEEFNRYLFRRISNITKKLPHFTVNMGVGSDHEGIDGITISYNEALLALQNKFIYGANKLFDYGLLSIREKSTEFFCSQMSKDLLLYIKSGNLSAIESALQELFEFIVKKEISFDNMLLICTGLVSICLSYITSIGKSINEVFEKDFSPISDIKNQKSIQSLQIWLIEIFKKTIAHLNNPMTSKADIILKEAIQYIKRNYSDSSLNVERIAQVLYHNSRYLRKIFQDKMGMTIVEYITTVRMEKAKQLIGESNMKYADIACMIGLSDKEYFSKCFKKHFGIPPSEYENEIIMNRKLQQ